jgi:succinyl-CoA synthetase beta subunit
VLTQDITRIVDGARETGWILEPDAKQLLTAAGLAVTRHRVVDRREALQPQAEAVGYPLVAKVVSPRIVHKSDCGGVVVGIETTAELEAIFQRFQGLDGFQSMLIEEQVAGVEVIIGAKNDFQFGPVVMLGIGGTGVELYGDTVLRMAPLTERDAASMMACLKAGRLLQGFRGSQPIDRQALAETLVRFSQLAMALDDRFESIDLNPVMCSADRCVIADARIMLPAPAA